MIEETRKKVASYFYKKTKATNKLTSMLTPYRETILNTAREQGRHFMVYPSSIDYFQVHSVNKPEEVHLGNKTYSCRKFYIIGIPCEHTMTYIAFCYHDAYAYCEEWVTTTKFRATYNNKVPPTRR